MDIRDQSGNSVDITYLENQEQNLAREYIEENTLYIISKGIYRKTTWSSKCMDKANLNSRRQI